MQFRGVDLLTLSACDTALGDGAEIEGFGALAQNQGAKGVIATLWKVTDRSTALFMQRFYDLLHDASEGETPTKAEALRRAQLALLHGEVDSGRTRLKDRGDVIRMQKDDSEKCIPFKPSIDTPFAHPYYWAPFILMGN